MGKHRNLRIFLTSFFASLLAIALVWGFAAVDYQSRRIGFGDGKTLIYRITGKNPDIPCIGVGIWYNNSYINIGFFKKSLEE
ncbi:MAG: hypothetical protein LKJ21_00410 [Oscillospiraceae bacterium]|jgi:hypothetical protein|nr:hypothetical protein [Oscillospiraceae bacterium]MCI1989849.1 hypothetical protein [Oscillospiraceae bacterium]MCI2034926.1 hypothetical protein [Oscillospiraceae bacterium]